MKIRRDVNISWEAATPQYTLYVAR